MQNFMTLALTESFVADAERRWLYGHPYRTERPRRARPLGRRAAARARRTATAAGRVRTA
jgi:hypothetical protein